MHNKLNTPLLTLIRGLFFLLSSLASFSLWANGLNPVAHRLDVTLAPQTHHIEVYDVITLDGAAGNTLTFSLNQALIVESASPDVILEKLEHVSNSHISHYQLHFNEAVTSIALNYSGNINQKLEGYGAELARGFRSTQGIISEEGVYLAGASAWYPQFDNTTMTGFELSVSLPEGWSSVSQGQRINAEQGDGTWVETTAQEEIYLIAAPFHRYQQQSGDILAEVYLREDDSTLANKYLDATSQYLQMYQSLLGDYLYPKFALVENFWETGYGMPSFTLLGSRVIRLPFIISSSYPHEILHNWWGNGVYVDYPTGNWSEGLTAFLADHLIKEQQGQGANYRQQALQKYSDYAAKGRDFPIAEFTGRHSSASEAVGYGKTLMLFNMLRTELGDKAFIEGLRKFYTQYTFKIAGFSDLQSVFENTTGKDLNTFFEQWVQRTGAPQLSLSNVESKQSNDGYKLKFTLEQQQEGPGYALQIPLAITLQGQKNAKQLFVSMESKSQDVEIALEHPAERLDIDPEFDLFRQLSIDETPAAFTRVFGSRDLLVLLPTDAPEPLKTFYSEFAQKMKKMGPDNVKVQWDSEFESLPEQQAITLIGWENRFIDTMAKGLAEEGVTLNDTELTLGNKTHSLKDHSYALSISRDDKQRTPLSLVATTQPAALVGLARKLPHYHKYSYVGFAGTEPSNNLKGRWEVRRSPMTAFLKPDSERAELKKRTALIEPASPFNQARMLATVKHLSAAEFKGRGYGSPELDKAAHYIAEAFKQAGLTPAGDTPDSYFQSWTAEGIEANTTANLKNVVAVIPGTNPKYQGQSVVIGAHYDHLGLGWPDVRKGNQGQIHHGADDNASGVSVLLEMARVFGKKYQPERSVVFVAFTGEEAGRMGSIEYLKRQMQYPADKIIGMVNLDSVGRLQEKNILVLGANSASEWQHIFRGVGFVTGVQSTMVQEELDSSDQVSFQNAGVPAVQLFSGVHLDYHLPSDTADKVDGEGLQKVATVTKEVVEYLAGREESLSSSLNSVKGEVQGVKTSRKVSLGTVPDFTFEGVGYRLSGVVPGSAAEVAGLKEGDVVVGIGGRVIGGLRDVSEVLKGLKAGQMVSVDFLRNGVKLEAEATLLEK